MISTRRIRLKQRFDTKSGSHISKEKFGMKMAENIKTDKSRTINCLSATNRELLQTDVCFAATTFIEILQWSIVREHVCGNYSHFCLSIILNLNGQLVHCVDHNNKVKMFYGGLNKDKSNGRNLNSMVLIQYRLCQKFFDFFFFFKYTLHRISILSC